jgi:hypothetical protein
MEVEMYRLGAVGLAVMYFLVAPCNCAGQQLPYPPSENHETLKIVGTLYYSGAGQPAVNVMIQLTDSQGAPISTTMTDESGGFRFGGLNGGTYIINIHVQDFQPIEMPVDLTYNSERGLDIYLKPVSLGAGSSPGSYISAHELSMPAKARELMDSGKKKLYEEKNARAGLEDFRAASEAAPGYYEPYYQIGMADMTLGDTGGAEKSFRKSIELSGDKFAEGEVGLGSLMIDKGNYAEGEKAIRRGIELKPTFWLGHYELGRMQMNQNLFADAEKSADEARALAPTALIVYRLLSNIHLQEKNYPALLGDLNAYIKLDPKSIMGVHAQQLRVQVEAKLTKEKIGTSADSKPNNP